MNNHGTDYTESTIGNERITNNDNESIDQSNHEPDEGHRRESADVTINVESDVTTDNASSDVTPRDESDVTSNDDDSDVTTDDVRYVAMTSQRPEMDIHMRANLTDAEILRLLPVAHASLRNHAQRLHECKELDCKRLASKECSGYCTVHFCQRYRNAQVDIPAPGSLDGAAARGFDVETSSDDNKRPTYPFLVARNTTSGSNDDNGATAGNREERQKRKATRSERSGSRPPQDEESSGSHGDGGNPKPQKCIGNMCNRTSLRGPLCDECKAILKAGKRATKKASKSYPCAFKQCHKRVFVKDTLCRQCNNNLSRARAVQTPLPAPDETLTLSERSRVTSPQMSRSVVGHPATRGQAESSPRIGRATLHPAEPQRPESTEAQERRNRDHYPDVRPRERVDVQTRTYREVRPPEYRVPQRQSTRYRDEPTQRLQDPCERQYSSRNERRQREARELQLRNERELQLQRDRDHELSLRYEQEERNYHHRHRRHEEQYNRNEPHRHDRRSHSPYRHHAQEPKAAHRMFEFSPSSDDSESPPSSFISETTNSYSVDDPRYNAEFMNQSSKDSELWKPEMRKPEGRKQEMRKPEMHHTGSHRGQCDSGNEYSSVAGIPARRRCLNPECGNYGNEKCDGFCNSCYGKLHR